MGADRQTLLHNLATSIALLRGEARVYSYHLMSSVSSFGFKDIEKRTPGGVHDGFRQVMVLHHGEDSQVLNGNTLIGLGVPLGNFEMMISALATDLQMRLGNIASRFPPSFAALLASAELALLASERLL